MRTNRVRSSDPATCPVGLPSDADQASPRGTGPAPVIPIGSAARAASGIGHPLPRSFPPDTERTASAIAIAATVGMIANLVAAILFATGTLA